MSKFREHLHQQIESAVQAEESAIAISDIASFVEQLENVFPVQVADYHRLQSVIAEAEEKSPSLAREAQDEMVEHHSKVIQAWEDLTSLGSINKEGLKDYLSAGVAYRSEPDCGVVFPKGNFHDDYDKERGYVPSADKVKYMQEIFPLSLQRARELQRVVHLWSVAMQEAAFVIQRSFGVQAARAHQRDGYMEDLERYLAGE